ncbi:substrate-binding domain-containing protein [Streptomyces sp. NPDC057545]|uniref:substrate-binding domain-containing protein n=1 Tax=unclassified Streptomyces TaxID=2593676 RepID=UPI0036C4AF06
MREGASRTAGVLVLDIANPFFTEMARGAEDRLVEAGLTMVLSSSDADPARERRILEQFAQQRLQGVMLTSSRGTRDNIGILVDHGTRVVLLDHRPKGRDLDAVAGDDVEGARRGGASARPRAHADRLLRVRLVSVARGGAACAVRGRPRKAARQSPRSTFEARCAT